MQSEREGRGRFFRSRGLLDSLSGFGSGRSMFPSLFGGRDPFDDPFFSRPLGSMFGPSSATSDAPESGGGASELLVEELNSDDEEEVGGEVTENGEGKSGKQSVSSTVPSVEHPDDVVEDGESKDVTYRNDHSKVEGAQSRGRTSSFQTCRVTYGGVDGAYYTSTKTTRADGDGVVLEEAKEADRTTGQATHRVSRGIHDKGHSVMRKLNSDGKVDMMQALHNLNEDELSGFEEAWNGNTKRHMPGWKNEFDIHGNSGPSSGQERGKASWAAGLLPYSEQSQSAPGFGSGNATRSSSDGRTKKIVRINIE